MNLARIADVEGRVRRRVEGELGRELAARGSARLRLDDQEWVYRLVGSLVEEERAAAGPEFLSADAAELWRRVFGSVTPLGPLAEHLADPEVEEIRINGAASCFVLRGGVREEVDPPFRTDGEIVDLVQWYADGTGSARFDRSSPTLTMTLPDGSRMHAALSPPARPVSVTIRRHPPARFETLSALATGGFMPEALIPFLEAVVRGRLNVLVAGGTGSGKTTFTRVLCRAIPDGERVITIEDQAELHLWRQLRDCISLEGRAANTEGAGEITIQMLVHEALRMSPDRIVIGEVRGAEALDLLEAMNTGHPGSICTLHSESPRDTLPRLIRLALRNPHAPRPEALAMEVLRTVDVVLHLGVASVADRRVRTLRSVGYVAGSEAGQPVVDELLRTGPTGKLVRTGSVASLPDRVLEKLATAGDVAPLLDGVDA